ncbi:MAG: chaperone modulator CbpM [Deltaproteobacteria bacterium]
MGKEFWTIAEVVEVFEIGEDVLEELEQGEVLCPVCREDSSVKLFPAAELEKLRIAKILIEDMGVNLPGVQIILRMRQTLFEMRRQQFDEILEDLAKQRQENINGTRRKDRGVRPKARHNQSV